jgi:hypothetical protein
MKNDKKGQLKVMWGKHKYYPKHYKTKREEFLAWLPSKAATTKHLQLILRSGKTKYRNEIKAELERRKQCQLNSNQTKKSITEPQRKQGWLSILLSKLRWKS